MTSRPTSHAVLSEELARAEADVERARERVSSSVQALRDEVVARTSRRSAVADYIKERPGRCLLGALALGFVIGKIARRV